MADQIHPENQEIDLSKVSKKIRAMFSRANDSIFDGILFIQRNIIILVILLIIGAGLGFYLDRSTNVYEHQLYVIPNFQSVDYLYSEVDQIKSKIREHDTVFLNKIGIKDPKNFGSIKVEPVVDIYEFIDDSDEKRLELFKILAENGDLAKILEDNTTSKNYKKHLITITTKDRASRASLVDPLLKYLNSSKYFDTIKKQSIENQRVKIAATDTVMKQIDAILNDYGTSSRAGASNQVYYKDNTDLNQVINLRTYLTNQQGKNKIDYINFQKVIKDSAVLMNVKDFSATTGRMKLILPLLLVFIFILIRSFRSYYRKQLDKRTFKPA